MKTIDRKKLASLVFSRLNETVPKGLLYDIIYIVSDDLSEKLLSDESISIENFGTLSTYVIPGHNARNIYTNSIEYIEPKRSIRLIPHATLDGLIQNRIKKFRS